MQAPCGAEQPLASPWVSWFEWACPVGETGSWILKLGDLPVRDKSLERVLWARPVPEASGSSVADGSLT